MRDSLQAFAVAYGPLMFLSLSLIIWAKYWVKSLNTRDAVDTFVLDFTPYTSDVAATERDLPVMRTR